DARMRINTFLHGVAFVLGFTLVFVVFGLLTTAFLSQIGGQNVALVRDVIGRAGGLLIIFFGLHFMGAIRWGLDWLQRSGWVKSPLLGAAFLAVFALLALWALVDPLIAIPVIAVFGLWMALGGAFTRPASFWEKTTSGLNRLLYTDTRKQMNATHSGGFVGSGIMGIVFAAGWTPCIGPIYGSILTLAATGGSVGQAGGLMIAYSLGLGVPFLMTALLLDSAQGLLRRLQKQLHKIEIFSGGLLVLIGVLVASGQLQSLSQNFANQFADFSYRLEECVVGTTRGELTLGDFGACMSGQLEAQSSALATPEAVVESTPVAATPASIAALASAAGGGAATTGTAVGSFAPDFTLTGDYGQTVQLSSLRGQPVLLNFWATWCGPCRIEMPAFEQAFQESGGALQILAVAYGQTIDDIAEYRAEIGVTFPLLADDQMDIGDRYGVAQIPSTFLIDPDGRIAQVHYGPLTAAQIAEMAASASA
ncbi:MAG TPA: cytochrome c biogenesis protein CcdA, partial [Candidatus Limnocylindrales bacterium]|nr:cytochrome c biogenesis protein CcdA [Candidatus Limnocylindrales bacterium]